MESSSEDDKHAQQSYEVNLDLVLGKVVDEVNVLEEVDDKVQELLPIAFRHCSIDTPIV